MDKITIVSTGDGAMGADKITTDMAKMVAQVPALFETLAGVKIGDLMGKVPGLANGEEKATTLKVDGEEGRV